MGKIGDELLRTHERRTLADPSAASWSRYAQELVRRGRADDAYLAASRAAELDPDGRARDFLVAGWSGEVVPWALPALGSPRRLRVDVRAASSCRWLDIGQGVLVLAHHPTAGREDEPLAHQPLELVAVDFPGERILWRRTYPWITYDFTAAERGSIYAVREGQEPWEHEVLLIDGRTGAIADSRRLEFDRSLRLPNEFSPRDWRHWHRRHEMLGRVFGFRATQSGRVGAIVGWDRAPEALASAPFDLPCVLVGDAPSWPRPFRLIAVGEATGHAMVHFDDATNIHHIYEIGRPDRRSRFEDLFVWCAATPDAFVLATERPAPLAVSAVDLPSGIRSRQVVIESGMGGEALVHACVQHGTLVVVAKVVDPDVRFAMRALRGGGRAPSTPSREDFRVVALDSKTLRPRWEAPGFGRVLATRDRVLCLTPPWRSRVTVVALDIETGAAREQVSVPWKPYKVRGESARDRSWGRGYRTIRPIWVPNKGSSIMLVAGRMVFSSAAGMFGLGE